MKFTIEFEAKSMWGDGWNTLVYVVQVGPMKFISYLPRIYSWIMGKDGKVIPGKKRVTITQGLIELPKFRYPTQL